MWTDNETDVDYLNFSGVAETVAELIVQAKARPISIGIAGAWGVGKSSMIRLVQAELESQFPRILKSRSPSSWSAARSRKRKRFPAQWKWPALAALITAPNYWFERSPSDVFGEPCRVPHSGLS
jgi:hypothetical protein